MVTVNLLNLCFNWLTTTEQEPHHVSFLVEFCITDPEEGLSIRPKRRKID